MADYQAGGVEIQVKALAGNATKSLTSLVNKVNELSGALTAVAPVFRSISTSIKGIQGIGSVSMKGLAGQLERISKVDMTAMGSSFNQLTAAVMPFLDKVKSAESGLIAMAAAIKQSTKASGALKQVARETKNVGDKADKTGISLKKAFSLGKLYVAINYAKRYAKAFENILMYSINFTETLNKFQVSMGQFTDKAVAFNEKIARAFGLSSAALMDMQATFNNMLKGMGNLDAGLAYGLSESLTQMVIDYSSLFNKSIEASSTAFQSMLSGQVKPIRTGTGIDTTEITKYQEYLSLGGTKTMRQLNQVEKRLLSILSVQKQLAQMGAEGDWAKTIEQPANQLRIMSEQFKELWRWVGEVFVMWAKNYDILQNINAALMTAVEMAKSLAYSLGYETPDFSIEVNMEDPLADLVDDAEAAAEKISGLFSFDKFETLQTGAATTDNGAVDEKILAAIKDYQSQLDNANMKARELSDTWLEQLGFVRNADTGVWELGDSTDSLIGKLTAVSKIVLSLLAGVAAAAMLKKIISIASALKGVITTLNPTMLIVAAIAALLLYLYNTNEDFRNSINNLWANLQPIIETLLKFVADLVVALMPLIDAIINALAPILVIIVDLIAKLMPFIQGIVDMVVAFLMPIIEALVPIITIIVQQFTGIFQIISGIVKLLTGDFNGAIDMIGKGLKNIWDGFVNGCKAAINICIGFLNGLIAGIISPFNWVIDQLNKIRVDIDWLNIHIGVNIPKIPVPRIPMLAEGGFPNMGEMFIARESGPELVGNIGGRTAVANNDQIVEAVANGVERAMLRSMSSGGLGNVKLTIDLKNANNSAVGRLLYDALRNEQGRRGVVSVNM